jgi:hypothetical protein
MSAEDNLSKKQFWQDSLFTPKDNGMPKGGVIKGDEHQPLYRRLAVPESKATEPDTLLNYVKKQSLGTHWTHNRDQTNESLTSTEHAAARAAGAGRTHEPFVDVKLEARHPGLEHAMSWDHPGDKIVLENTVVTHEGANHLARPEVSIRPGTKMKLTAIHLDGKRHEVNDEHIA